MTDLPTQIASIVAILGALTALIYALVKLLPKFSMSAEEKDTRRSAAGVTFEERLATLEFGQMKLETNHLAHIQDDIKGIRNDIDRITDSIADIRERVARLEVSVSNH